MGFNSKDSLHHECILGDLDQFLASDTPCNGTFGRIHAVVLDQLVVNHPLTPGSS